MNQELVDPEDLSAYSVKELKQLLEINKQTLDYYNKLLEDTKLSEDERKALTMCKQQIEADIDGVLNDLKKRELCSRN